MHIPWEAVKLFLVAAEERSLSRSAKKLGITQPTVSRKLAELEAEIGEPLFVRSVEGVSLTPFGERLLEPAQRMAEIFGEVERLASGAGAEPRGTVRITAPPGVASELLVPFAAKLRVALPDVTLEILASVQYLDLSRREADLALRAARPNSRDIVCLATLEEPIAAYASSSYVARLVARLGHRYVAADIDWIAWPASHAELPPNPQLARLIPDFRPVFASDDFLVQLDAAEAGVGAVILGRRASRLAARGGALVRLDLALPRVVTTTNLLCARSALGIARVRAVAELLARELVPGARRERGPVGV